MNGKDVTPQKRELQITEIKKVEAELGEKIEGFKRVHNFDYSNLNLIWLILEDYENWLLKDENVWQLDFCVENRQRFGLPLYWFQMIEEKMVKDDFWEEQDRKELQEFYRKIEKVRESKIIMRAIKKKSEITSSIFYLKAKHGWRDGNEKSNVTVGTINYLNLEGMSLKELEAKARKLSDDSDDGSDIETAEFEELK